MTPRRRHWMGRLLLMTALVTAPTRIGLATDTSTSTPVSSHDAAPGSPLIPDRLLWPGIVVIVVIAIFVTAALAGPIIRANNQDEISDSGSEERK